MQKSSSKLMPYHLLLCWLFTVVAGSFFGCLFMGAVDASLFFIILSGLTSLPFILVFLLIFRKLINSEKSTLSLQLKVFGLHVLGTILTFGGFVVFFNSELSDTAFEFILILTGYFLLDSILFHTVIYRLHGQTNLKPVNEDLIDDI